MDGEYKCFRKPQSPIFALILFLKKIKPTLRFYIFLICIIFAKNIYIMKKIALLSFVLSFVWGTMMAQQTIHTENLKKHIDFLASDALKGRGTASKEEKKAAKYIAKYYKKLGILPKGDEGTYYHHFTFKRSSDPHGGVSTDAKIENSRNVAAFIDNNSAFTVVIGAHYDHLGLGHDHNSREANPHGLIHNGADDNASGTAGVMELARYFHQNGVKEKYNFLFLHFSGEELGLVGSKKYCERPTVDLKSVNYMINMDMIGRLNAERVLKLGGVGTSPNFVPAVMDLATDLKIKKDSSGTDASDHTSFYLQNIPVLFAFTGQHDDYHKASDDVEKINYEGETAVLQYLANLIQVLDNQGKQSFQATKSTQQKSGGFKVTMGVMPDYVFEGVGMRIDGVTDGKPAAKAGLQKGDVVVKLGDDTVKDVQGYMQVLSKYKKGDATTVTIKRGEEEKTFPVTF
jgi:hypothetical protein